jgi:hypothetical protein
MSLDTIKDYLSYDSETGEFRWIKKPKRSNGLMVVGGLAGCVHKVLGYHFVSFGGTSYYAHRLAWWWVHGEMPAEQVDHINGNRADNRIANLRPVSIQKNRMNKCKQSNNTSGYKGVYYRKDTGKWSAQIGMKGNITRLGCYNCPTLAALAYDKAAREMHGSYACVNFPDEGRRAA